MHDGPSPVIRVLHWRGKFLYIYRPNIAWVWRRWRYDVSRSRTGRITNRRLFAGPLELSL